MVKLGEFVGIEFLFCTSGDAMRAVCTGHLLLRFETPRTQEAKKGKPAKQKTTQNTKTSNENKNSEREHPSEVKQGETGTTAVCYLGHEFKFKLLLRVVDSYAKRLCTIGLCVDRPNKHLLAQVL